MFMSIKLLAIVKRKCATLIHVHLAKSSNADSVHLHCRSGFYHTSHQKLRGFVHTGCYRSQVIAANERWQSNVQSSRLVCSRLLYGSGFIANLKAAAANNSTHSGAGINFR